MKQHDDPFYELIREELHNYKAKPPEGAQAGIYRKLNKGAFFKFSWYRMNVYFAVLLAGGVTLTALLWNQSAEDVSTAKAAPTEIAPELSLQRQVIASNTVVEQQLPETPAKTGMPESEVKPEFSTQDKSVISGQKSSPSEANTLEVNDGDTPKLLASAGHSESAQSALSEEDDASASMIETQDVAQASCSEEMSKIEMRQLPANWLQHVGSPDLQKLIADLESDNETIYITLPVKVQVQKED